MKLLSFLTYHAPPPPSGSKNLYTWGSNRYGNLGFIKYSSPLAFSSLQPSFEGSHSVGLASNGLLYAWGLNSSGQLGDGTTIQKISPVQIGSSSWSAISTANLSSMAIKSDSYLFSWGTSVFNAGDSNYFLTNIKTLDGSDDFIDYSWINVSSGKSHTAAIRSDYKLFCWGHNDSGQVGVGASITGVLTNPVSQPQQIGSSSWIAVSAGFKHTLALRSDGMLFAWGSGVYTGEVESTATGKSIPRETKQFNDQAGFSWTMVSAGFSHAVAIRSDGLLYAWGSNDVGQLGDSTTIAKSIPVQIGSSSWTFVTSGGSHTVAIRADNTLWAWGRNNAGQLGDGTTINKSSPVQITSQYTSSWTQIAAGNDHTHGIATDGYSYSWGNLWGILGGSNQPFPAGDVYVLSDNRVINNLKFKKVAVGLHPLFISEDDKLYAKFTYASAILTPYDTVLPGKTWTEITSGQNDITDTGPEGVRTTVFAITSDGELYAGGDNTNGNLGNGTTTGLGFPARILSDKTFSKISCKRRHTLAITTNGTLWAFGLNDSGQLGDGTTINRSSPVQIGSNSWIAVATGSSHSLAIRYDGMLFAWGAGNDGRLGDGTVISKSSPVQIGSDSWVAIAAGTGHSMGIKSGGTLWGFGYNAEGSLGDSTNISRNSPVQIGTRTGWKGVAAWWGNTSAIDENDNLWSWGLNFTYPNYASGGVIGDGKDYPRPHPNFNGYQPSPVLIGGSSKWKTTGIDWSGAQPISNNNYGYAVRDDGTLYFWGGANFQWRFPWGAYRTWLPVRLYHREVSKISVGISNITYFDSSGYMYNMGLGTSGQLGNGSAATIFSPVQIGSSSWTAVSWGGAHGIGISANRLFTWGLNSSGQLGDGTTVNKSSPVQIGSDSWTAVASGNNHSLAIRSDSLLFAWGLNSTANQLGDGTSVNKSSPVQIGSSSWTAISSDFDFSAGLVSGGTLLTWGQNSGNQLARPNGTFYPYQINFSSWISISAGELLSAAIRSDNILFTWGQNNLGQMGDGTTINKSSPTQIGSSSWIAVSVRNSHSAAIRSGGTLFTWGLGTSGQLGDGTVISKSSPVQIGSDSWTAVSVGNTHTLGIKSDGILYSWGVNSSFQLGDGTSVNKSSPVQIGSSSWTTISAGDTHSIALRSDGLLFAWGLGTSGQIGDSSILTRSSPVQIGIGMGSWTITSAGGVHSSAVKSNGLLFTWGDNSQSQLGRPFSKKPFKIFESTGTWASVSLNVDHTLAVDSLGRLWTWGNNSSGQLGDGSTNVRTSPLQIGSSSWTAVAAGKSYSFAIRSDGMLFAWGVNTNGVLGDGTTINRSSPVQIGSSSWIAVSSENLNTVAIRSGGTLFTWGLGTSGQLGDGTVISKSSPVQIGSSSWVAVSAGTSYALAIRSGGTLFSWGLNSAGQLGDGTTINKSSPVQIGSSSWTSISSAADYNLGLIGDRAYAWGSFASSGRLGLGILPDGINVNFSGLFSPVAIGGESTFINGQFASPVLIGEGP